jgi:hypothetical protein
VRGTLLGTWTLISLQGAEGRPHELLSDMVRQARYRNATLDRFSPEMELRVCFAGELVRGSAEEQNWEDLGELLDV